MKTNWQQYKLKLCQACGCHQSFHRKVSVQEKIRQDVIDLPENEIDHSDASNTNTRAVTLKGSKGSAKESTNKLYLIREEGDEAERTSKKSNQKETEDHANAKQSSSSKVKKMVKKEQPVKRKTTLTSYNIDSGDCIRVGDSVIIRPCKKRAGSRKGRVEGFREDPRNGVQAMIKHYFDPEDAKHGRRSFHGKREVFLSDMTNEVHGDSIECRINLYHLDEYLQLQCADDELEHTDYFYRLYYDYEKRTFKTVSLMGEVTENGELRVYCKCFMPENPDEFWIPCNGCEDWFHPRCIGTTRKEAETPGYKYVCSRCSAD